ncbi:hypothetical protein [Sporisorium scitamineum]|uniref:Uncharacterized protein n=1 Tax=Sporisorium scitamineum TaxID=49012 RepID=A0A0F7RVJ6_9BASI|nr:hypothetical protein [Sporisorium scitamineum]
MKILVDPKGTSIPEEQQANCSQAAELGEAGGSGDAASKQGGPSKPAAGMLCQSST